MSVDYADAGLNDSDLAIIQMEVPNIVLNSNPLEDVIADIKTVEKPYEELKEQIKQAKVQQKEIAAERQQNEDTYLIHNFENLENKMYFLEIYQLPYDNKIVKGEMFLKD